MPDANYGQINQRFHGVSLSVSVSVIHINVETAEDFVLSINILFCYWERWVRFGKDLELLDSPGILPMRISDQSAAIKLAICDDIGERSYDVTDVAAILVQMLSRLPSVGVLSFHFL